MDFCTTFLLLLEEACYQTLGRFNGPHNVSGAHTENGKNRSWKAASSITVTHLLVNPIYMMCNTY